MTAEALWPHQVEAVKAVVAEIALQGRCRITMACGTGKTLVGAEVSGQVAESGRVLVIVPTLELLAQTARSYVAHLGAQAGTVAAVCSDDGAATIDRDELQAELDQLHVGCSTDSGQVAQWLSPPGRITVLSTYHSLPVIAAAHSRGAHAWDLIVIDEAHRSAGRTDRAWHIVHQGEAIPARRRLYMTATPRIIGTDRFEATSMDDTNVFGPEVYQVPFARAIEEELLADYRVLVTTMTEAELAKLDEGPDTVVNAGGPGLPAQMLVAQLALLKAYAQYGVRRAITFHHRVARAKQFARTLHNAADLLPVGQRPDRMYAACVDGTMRLEERRAVLRHLDRPAGRLVVVSNARVLGEGVDVPELDAVVFADPRDSTTDVVQAVGRALRRGRSGNKTAYIIVPILIHEAQNLQAALDTPGWDKLLQVIRALSAHDERLSDELNARRTALTASDYIGKEPTRRHGLPQWLDLTGTTIDPGFAEAVKLHVLERTTSVWLEGLGAAQAFHATNGHLRVELHHVTETGMALGRWIANQRSAKNSNRLSPEQVQALDQLGMIWDPHHAQWEEWLTTARAFHTEHGHLRPGRDQVVHGRNLGEWIRSQRVFRRKGQLSAEWIADLDKLDMIWDLRKAEWHDRLAEAQAYCAEHGHLRVPRDYVAPGSKAKLGAWIGHQRKRKSKLTPEEVEQLEAVGMTWDPRDTNWRRNYAALVAFLTEHHHVDVPHTYVTTGPDPISLGVWVANLRHRQRQGDLAEDRIEALNALGFDWKTNHD